MNITPHLLLVLIAVVIAVAAVVKERSLAAIGLLFLTLVLLVLP
jgi:hypothetical protein